MLVSVYGAVGYWIQFVGQIGVDIGPWCNWVISSFFKVHLGVGFSLWCSWVLALVCGALGCWLQSVVYLGVGFVLWCNWVWASGFGAVGCWLLFVV